MKNGRPYIFYIVSFTRSNGIRAMMLLADRLAGDGYEVHYFVQNAEGWDDDRHQRLLAVSDALKRDAVVVYPEIVAGNPLRVRNVARMVLFYPGRNGGTRRYHKSEMLFAYDREYLPSADVLTVPWIDTELFNDPRRPRTRDCVFVYKGGRWRDVPELEGLTEITMQWPKIRRELADLLKQTRTLYSFDAASALLDEAQFCGVDVKIVTKDGFEDYPNRYAGCVREFPAQYANFVKKTQASDYRGRLQSKWLLRYWAYAVWRYWIKPIFCGRPTPPPIDKKGDEN